jgi:ABC-type dipeptide/oligopeptide/nickel transport system permease subunit
MLDPRVEELRATQLPGAIAAERAEVDDRQFSFRELTYRRFMAHPLAKWGTLGLVVILVLCYGAPVWHFLFPGFIQAPDQFTIADASQAPSLRHLLGTDSYNGHDILSLILYGGRISLLIGIGGMIVATIIGIPVGAVAGYAGGLVDAFLMRITDVMLSIPILLLVPLAARIFGEGNATNIAIIFGLFSWMPLARILRSYILSLKEMQFTEAARALGVPTYRIIFRHLLPNAIGPIVVSFTLGIALNIVLEAFVSFLGFGIQPPTYSWGSTLTGAQGVMIEGNWWWITFPGLAVVMTVLFINFMGDGLRDALDPKIVN